jgi:hypothetical protein
MLLFKEKKRERDREKVVCWFLIRDWIKDVCSHNSITLSFCPNSRGRRRRRRKRKRGYILSSSIVCTAHLAQIQNKKAQNCSGASIDDERRKKKKVDINTYKRIVALWRTFNYMMIVDRSHSFFMYLIEIN